MKILTFDEALRKAERYNKRHLLLGNGFSIACIPSIFTYSSLFKRADFSDMPEVAKAFEFLGTQDFELVINSLEKGSSIIPAYLPDQGRTVNKMKRHSAKLKERLIETIAQNHPTQPGEIEDYRYDACAHFLSYFLDSGCTVYTLNYDLLLYWTLMYAMDRKLIRVLPMDGFGRDTDLIDGEVYVSDYVTWQGDTKAHSQNIHYLHGALHIYDRGADVEKFTWADTGIRLVDQARQALSEGRFPLFIAEGESKQKMNKIIHCGYLYHSFKSFSSTMRYGQKNSKSCLFTYGVSFSANDEHILAKIPKGKVAHLFVSIYGDPNTAENKRIIAAAEKLKTKRADGELQIDYYDAASAEVWG
ncbi:MAG: DUF4917 family protein [Sphingobacteriales bacterium]|nr:MAG: DUF4917 family protein [Sphingobacteriales bacterium]